MLLADHIARRPPLRYTLASVTALRRQRPLFAALLAGGALLCLVGLPLLHAEAHAQGAGVARARAAQRAFALGFLAHRSPAQEQELRDATEEAFGGEVAEGAAQHVHDGAPRHSHGGGRHGEGALEHLGLAFASASPPPQVSPPPVLPAHVAAAPAPAPLLSRYLVPRFAQGPPLG